MQMIMQWSTRATQTQRVKHNTITTNDTYLLIFYIGPNLYYYYYYYDDDVSKWFITPVYRKIQIT